MYTAGFREIGIISASTLQDKNIFLGDASTWPTDAINAGYTTGSEPRQGAIAVWSAGHVAFVENVVNGVAYFSECNATPTSVNPNTIVICRDDQDSGGWKVKLRDSPSTSGNSLGYLPKFGVFSVVGGPTSANGYDWYHIQGAGCDGWSALLDIDTGDAATKNFSWSFTRIKLNPSASSISVQGSPSQYIYLSSPPSEISVTVTTNPSVEYITVDGVSYSPAHIFTWTAGSSHNIATPSPQYNSAGTIRYTFANWSDGGSQAHSVSPSTNSTFTATFTMQYL